MNTIRVGFWTRIAFFFLFRSGRTAAALSIMVTTAVAALIFLSSLTVGVEDAMLRNTVGLFSGHITGYHLATSLTVEDLRIDGVKAVLRRSYADGILSTNGLAYPVVTCRIDPAAEVEQTALINKLTEGRYPAAGKREILISRTIADTVAVNTGEKVRFSSTKENIVLDFTVSGIFETGISTIDRGIAFIPWTPSALKNEAWSAAVFLNSGVDSDSVIRIYRRRFSEPARFESWASQMPDLKQLIDLETISMVIVILLVFGVVAIGIACSFVIFIIRNMREYGILKAMGVTTAEMSLLILSKVALMNVLACSAGLLMGLIVVFTVTHMGGIDISRFTSHNQYFSVSGIIVPRLTVFSLWTPPAVALSFGLVAALWPVAMVARKKAADILRMV